MDRGSGAPERRGIAGAAIIGAVAVVVLLVATRRYGLTVANDSVAYAGLADHLRAGDGWAGAPWPPLYPLLLAGIGRLTTLDAYGAALAVNVASLLVMVGATFSLLRRLLRSELLVLLGVAVVALAPALLGVVTMMSSDAPFAAFTLVVLAALPGAVATPRSRRALITVVVALWALWLTRWAGQFIAAGVCLVVLLVPRTVAWTRRLAAAVALGTAALALPAAWMVRNLVVTGTLTQESHGSEENLNGALRDTTSTVAEWMIGRAPDNRVAAGLAAVAVVAVVAGVGVLLRRNRTDPDPDFDPDLDLDLDPRDPDADLPATSSIRAASIRASSVRASSVRVMCVIVVVTYAGVLTIGKPFVGYDLDRRVLAPAFVPLLCLGLGVADDLLDRLRARSGSRAGPVLVVAGVGVWALVLVGGGLRDARRLAVEGDGFASASVHRLDAIDALHRLPTDCTLLTNQPGMLRYLGGPPAAPTPARLPYRSDIPTNELETFVAASRSPTSATCIVWLDAGIVDRFQYPLADLQRAVRLERIDGGEHDGATVEVLRVHPG